MLLVPVSDCSPGLDDQVNLYPRLGHAEAGILFGLPQCLVWAEDTSSALGAEAVELEFVVKLAEACGRFDLFLQRFDRAGDVQALNAAALGANQVVIVMSGVDQGVVGTAVVQA